MAETPTTTVRIPLEVHAALKALAERHDRTINGEATYAIKQYIRREHGHEEWRAGRTQEAGR